MINLRGGAAGAFRAFTWLCLALFSAHAVSASGERPPRQLTLTWKLNPEKMHTPSREIYVAVPTVETPYQSVAYELVNVHSHREIHIDGNLVLAVRPRRNEIFKLKVKMTARPHDYRKTIEARTSEPLPREVEPFLRSSGTRIKPGSRALSKVAETLKDPDDVATVNNTLNWIKENIRYQWPHKHKGPVDEVVERGFGCCGCISELFVGLCRANGIPARCLRVGFKAQYSKPGELCGHTDAEVYIRGAGWIPVHPQHPGSLGLLPDKWFKWYHYGTWSEDPKLTMSEYISPPADQGTALIFYQEETGSEDSN